MANYRAITAVSKSIEALVKEAVPKSEFNKAEVRLVTFADFKQNPPLNEGVTIYLYRLEVSTLLRNRQQPADSNGNRPLPPLPLDLHYLVTAWATEADQQHLLLGKCMRALQDTPTLSAGLLNHYYPGDDVVFQKQETIQITLESLSLPDLLGIWDAFKPHHEVFASYLVRMVRIDSEVTVQTHGEVQTRAFDAGTLN